MTKCKNVNLAIKLSMHHSGIAAEKAQVAKNAAFRNRAETLVLSRIGINILTFCQIRTRNLPKRAPGVPQGQSAV